jgi:RNA polymerase sigma-70 factor (ECF subfamily)
MRLLGAGKAQRDNDFRRCDPSRPERILLDRMSSSFAIDVPADLIARLKRGDERAFEQVYRWFERPIYSVAWRLLHDAHEAEEVLHDVMLHVMDKLDQFRGDAPFWGWLRQIAVNEALMRLRKRRIDYVDEIPEPEAAVAEFAATIESADLERALAGLPAVTRSVIWLYLVEGYSHEEIAAGFDKSVSFSKTQLSRGTRKLRDLLQLERGVAVYA